MHIQNPAWWSSHSETFDCHTIHLVHLPPYRGNCNLTQCQEVRALVLHPKMSVLWRCFPAKPDSEALRQEPALAGANHRQDVVKTRTKLYKGDKVESLLVITFRQGQP
jgi:hypothetical protein